MAVLVVTPNTVMRWTGSAVWRASSRIRSRRSWVDCESVSHGDASAAWPGGGWYEPDGHPTVIRWGTQLTERARDLFAIFRELGLGLEVEVSVVGVDRHEEIMQKALEPGQPEGVGPRIAEPDRRVPGELVSAVSQREAYAS